MVAVLQPSDAGVIRCTRGAAPCRPSSQPWVIAAASLGSGMAFLDSTVMNVALPAVQAELGASVREVQWSYGAFALVLSALILVGGTLGDRFGRRLLFVVGAAIFGAASLWCALVPDTGQLVVARAVQGLGGALLIPASLAIVGASFEGKQRARAIGAWGALSGLAMAVGPVLGGLLVEYVSWRAAFLMAPAMAIVAIPIALSHVPESRDPDARRLDLAGAILATSGLAGVIYALIESSVRGFGDSRVLAGLVIGLIAFSAFVLVEQHARHPMVPPSLFHSRNFTGANLVTLLFYMALTGSLFFLPFLMMQVHGYSAFVAGSVFLPFVAMALLIGRFSGRISTRFGAKVPLIVASLALAAGLLAVAVLGAFIYGAFSFSLDARMERMDMPGDVRSAMEAEKADLGAAEAPAGVNEGMEARIERAIDESFVAGFRAVMLASAGLALASALIAALMVGDPRSSSTG